MEVDLYHRCGPFVVGAEDFFYVNLIYFEASVS